MKNNKFIWLGAIAMMFLSCDMETDLEVVQVEDPSSIQIGIEATANKIYQNWYQAANNYTGPGLSLAVMSDQMTCSWGNSGMRDTSSEPRIAWDNNSTYGSSGITESFFNSMYSVLADSNGLVAGIIGGSNFSDNDKVEALARFGQAAALGSLAQVFNKVYVSDETGTLNDGLAYTYAQAMDLAIQKIDLAIIAADRGDFTLTESQINGNNYSSAEFSKYLNSYAARLLATSARNASERAALDWNKILGYANNGLDFDVTILGDGYLSWYSEWNIYMIYPGWARVDLRTINMMDPSYPDYWPASEVTLPPATSVDARLASDYDYLSSQDFIANRGTYHYSSYRYKRYDSYTNTNWQAYHPEFLAAENDLYKAEALMRTGNMSGAAAVLNAGTRTSRGNLANVAAVQADVAAAIHYERIVELGQTGLGLAFFEMRGLDLLQSGTLLHFPIPGAALDANSEDNYTFGGSTGVAGQDYSNGGWR
jgi:hypothetical protein